MVSVILFAAGVAKAQGGSTSSGPPMLGHQYSTSGHPKAKGLVVTVKYPTGWEAAEGERPNIVQKFSEKRSDGLTRMAGLAIHHLPEEMALIPQDELYAELSSMKNPAQELKEMFPPNTRIMSASVTKYDGAPGLLCVYVMQAERAGCRLEMHTVQHMVFHKGKLLIFECSVGGLADSPGIPSLFQESKRLFIMMGNSIVLQDKWVKEYDPVGRTGISTTKGTAGDNWVPALILSAVGDNWVLALIVSVVLTWGIGLTPPLLIRYAVLRRPLAKGWAWGIAACFFFINVALFVALGSQSKTHYALILVAWASYAILHAGAKKLPPTVPPLRDQAGV
jgi:hypothetical protein